MKNVLSVFFTALGGLLLMKLSGCGAPKDTAGVHDGAIVRVNLAVVTIRGPFWKEHGFHSLSTVGNCRTRRQQVAARLMCQRQLPYVEFFFRHSWIMKQGDAVAFCKSLPAPQTDVGWETYPVAWTGRVGFTPRGKLIANHKIFYKAQFTYRVSGHSTNETILDCGTIRLGSEDMGADMILRVVQGDTSIWTVIGLSSADEKPVWKNR